MNIVIIKLGADGDVLRTLPLAEALKTRYNAHITWITRGDIVDLLHVKYIDTLKRLPYTDTTQYDALYNFDIDEEATTLASAIPAKKKYGFYREDGFPLAFNPGAEYYLNTVFDDVLKKSNLRTYQDMMFELAELPHTTKKYELVLEAHDKHYADAYAEHHGLKGKKIIGIHMGASSRWPSKVWDREQLAHFIKLANDRRMEVILFGGPNEAAHYKRFIKELEKKNLRVYQNNPNNTKREFAALLNLCHVVVCNDSFALHVSLGLGKKTIALFFCTSPNEVEGYGLLTKLVAPRLLDFFPEHSNEYNRELTASITAEDVARCL